MNPVLCDRTRPVAQGALWMLSELHQTLVTKFDRCLLFAYADPEQRGRGKGPLGEGDS